MSKNGRMEYVGVLQLVPSNGRSSKQSKPKPVNSSTSMTRTASYSDNKKKVSNSYTKSSKSGEYVTKSGSVGYQREAKATSTVKVTDKVRGTTTEYQTQVKVNKRVYPTTPKSSTIKITYY